MPALKVCLHFMLVLNSLDSLIANCLVIWVNVFSEDTLLIPSCFYISLLESNLLFAHHSLLLPSWNMMYDVHLRAASIFFFVYVKPFYLFRSHPSSTKASSRLQGAWQAFHLCTTILVKICPVSLADMSRSALAPGLSPTKNGFCLVISIMKCIIVNCQSCSLIAQTDPNGLPLYVGISTGLKAFDEHIKWRLHVMMSTLLQVVPLSLMGGSGFN